MQRKERTSFFGGGRDSIPSPRMRWIFFLLISSLLATTRTQEQVGDSCATGDGEDGICRPLRHCPSLVSKTYVYNGAGANTPDLCSYQSQGAIVCCPTKVETRSDVDKPNDGGDILKPVVQSVAYGKGRVQVPAIQQRTPQTISEQKCQEYTRAVDEDLAFRFESRKGQERCPFTPPSNKLIVGGTSADRGEYPHIAAIGYLQSSGKVEWLCGGSLISRSYILTAGHCTKGGNGRMIIVGLGQAFVKSVPFRSLITNVESRSGSSGYYPVGEIIRHPNYTFSSSYNDIALVRLSQSVNTFDEYVRPVCLYEDLDNSALESCTAAGYGFTNFGGDDFEEKLLRQVTLKFYNQSICNGLYEVESRRSNLAGGVLDSMFCAGDLAGGKDTCQGDSGGPLQVKDTIDPCVSRLVGVTSFGKVCGLPKTLGIYTRVSYFIPWIESVVWPSKK